MYMECIAHVYGPENMNIFKQCTGAIIVLDNPVLVKSIITEDGLLLSLMKLLGVYLQFTDKLSINQTMKSKSWDSEKFLQMAIPFTVLKRRLLLCRSCSTLWRTTPLNIYGSKASGCAWFQKLGTQWFKEGIQKLFFLYTKYIDKDGDYIKK